MKEYLCFWLCLSLYLDICVLANVNINIDIISTMKLDNVVDIGIHNNMEIQFL